MPTRALAPAAGSALLALLVPAAAVLAEPFEVAGPLSAVRLRELARNLPAITAIAWADTPAEPGRLFLALREGQVAVWDGSRILPDPLLDIRSQVSTGGESGLLGLAFHPGFAGNGLFFVHYTDSTGATRLARYRTLPGDPIAPTRRAPSTS